MSLYPFFVWCNETALASAIRESIWLFPVIEVFHLLAMSTLGGALLIVDLRLLGLGLANAPLRRLAQEALAWWRAGLSVAVVSGVLLFVSEAIKCYETPLFWWKLDLLAAAIVFTVFVRSRWTRQDDARPSLSSRLVGATSLGLWLSVALAGRGIGFW